MLKIIAAGEVEKYLNRRDVLIIDLRNKDDFEQMHLRKAVNLSYDYLVNRRENRIKAKTLLIYCDKGNLSLKACVRLERSGYNCVSVAGGFESLKAYYGN